MLSGSTPISGSVCASRSVDFLKIEPQPCERELHDPEGHQGSRAGLDMPSMGPNTKQDNSLSAEARLDKKFEFWEEYSKVAKEYDGELVKDLGDDLNSLLTFAGLFSATNTAFILEAMKDLKEDATQTTNDLLRSVARGLRDPNFIYETNQSPVFIASRRAIRVNALLFASLCCSLFTALGAILGKQWINHYGNWGPIRSLSEKSRERQKKLLGLERWHLEVLLQTLPSLIQLSLFLFLVALVDYLWELDGTVTAVVLGVSILTLAFYALTTLISVYDPASPFQNRFSRFLRGVMIGFFARSRLLIPWLKQLAKKLRMAVKSHQYHFIWTWPVVLLGIHHPSFDHVIDAISPGEFFLFYPCVFLDAPVRSVAKSRLLYRFAAFLEIHRFFDYSPDPIRIEEEEDVFGAECVRWLWQHRSTDPGIDDAILDVASVLNAADIASSGCLENLITILLKPVSENGVVTSLKVDIDRLRDFLEPLSRWISQFPSTPPYLFEVTEDEDGSEFSLWRHLGVKFWQLLVTRPNDIAAVQLIASIVKAVDSLYGRFRWSLSGAADQTEYMENAIRVQDILQSVAGKSPSNPILADYLTITGCLYWGCSEVQRVHLLSLKSADSLRGVLVSTLIIHDHPDKEQWRGRLRLLCLQGTLNSPSLFYVPLRDQSDLFSQSLERWVAADGGINRRWIRHWLRIHHHTPIGLYFATIRLLLVNDHSLWYSKLDGVGHSQFIRKLMISQGMEAFFSWQWKGKKVLPLACVLSVWHYHHKIEPESDGSRTYLTPDWYQSITTAVNHIGSINSVPEKERSEFSLNMMESRALMEMMESLREYLRAAASAGLMDQRGITTIVRHYRGIGQLLQDWVATTPFVPQPADYDSDFWRANWNARIQEECEKVTDWSVHVGVVEPVSVV